MKHLSKYLAYLMLLATTTLSIQAQDAFYIYQNDGHFDGFFYDEVQKISYSKIDTLGFEHEDYVSQEIITADSVYRIMLTAIDSVGFVQPEIQFRSNVRRMREDGLINYVGYHDVKNMQIYFYGSTPADKLPRIGDVLVDFDLEEGFSGKVVEIDDSGLNTIIKYEPLESIRDVFQRFVCVEQIDKDSQGALVRRRVAGAPQLTEGNWNKPANSPNKASDQFEGNILNFGFSGHLPLYASDDFNATLDANLAVALSIKGSYNIPVIGAYYIGLTFQQDVTMGLGITLDGKLSEMKKRETPFGASVPIPTAAPIFELRSVPGLFLRGEAHVKFSADLIKKAQRVWYKLEFNDDWLPSFNFGSEQLPELDEAISDPYSRDASIEFNGFIQAGLHAPLELGVNRWLSKIIDASFGTYVYLGPKLSGALNFSISDAYKDQLSFYNLIKGSNLSLTPLSLDYETKATLNTLFSGKKEVTIADGSTELIRPISLYLVPEFNVEVTGKGNTEGYVGGDIEAKITPSRNIIWPTDIGVGVYKKDKLITSIYTSDLQMPPYSQFSNTWKETKHFEPTLQAITPGYYMVRPMIRMSGVEFPASPAVEVKVPGTYLKLQQNTIFTSCEGGWVEVPIEAQFDSISVYDHSVIEEMELPQSGKDGNHTIRLKLKPYYGLADTLYCDIDISVYQKDNNGSYVFVDQAHQYIGQKPNDKMLPKAIMVWIQKDDEKMRWELEYSGKDFTSSFTEKGLHIEKMDGGESDNEESLWKVETWSNKFNFAFDINASDSKESSDSYSINNYTFDKGTFSKSIQSSTTTYFVANGERKWVEHSNSFDKQFSGSFDNIRKSHGDSYNYRSYSTIILDWKDYINTDNGSTNLSGTYHYTTDDPNDPNVLHDWSYSGTPGRISIEIYFEDNNPYSIRAKETKDTE